jgi:galactonate dehydratase
MKIAAVTPIIWINPQGADGSFGNCYLWVRVTTEDGLWGTGEAGFLPKPWTVVACMEDMARHMIGRNASHIEEIWQHLYRQPYERGGPVIMSALGAIDMALWDLAGKRHGVPTCELLGGPVRKCVRVYTNAMANTGDPDEEASLCEKQAARGFTALRLLVPECLIDQPLARLVGTMTDVFTEARRRVGDEVDLALECHRRLRPHEVITLARALERFNLLFLEDPIMAEDIGALKEISDKTIIPIATGENFYTMFQFRDLIASRAIKFCRVDLALAGGITCGRKVAAIADAHYVQMVPHNPFSPIATAAYAHYGVTLPNLLLQEYTDDYEQPKRGLVDEPLELRNGALWLGDKPGMGVELQQHVLERSAELMKLHPKDRPIPWTNPVLQRRDGALSDW